MPDPDARVELLFKLPLYQTIGDKLLSSPLFKKWAGTMYSPAIRRASEFSACALICHISQAKYSYQPNLYTTVTSEKENNLYLFIFMITFILALKCD